MQQPNILIQLKNVNTSAELEIANSVIVVIFVNEDKNLTPRKIKLLILFRAEWFECGQWRPIFVFSFYNLRLIIPIELTGTRPRPEFPSISRTEIPTFPSADH
jgi:hypothetical protein